MSHPSCNVACMFCAAVRTLDALCISDWPSLARTKSGEQAPQTVDLAEDAVDYIIAACLDCCRDVSGVETARFQLQVTGAEAADGAGVHAVVAALRRAAFSPSTPDGDAPAPGCHCSSQAGGWGLVAMQRSLL